jgi:hypothetical protein
MRFPYCWSVISKICIWFRLKGWWREVIIGMMTSDTWACLVHYVIWQTNEIEESEHIDGVEIRHRCLRVYKCSANCPTRCHSIRHTSSYACLSSASLWTAVHHRRDAFGVRNLTGVTAKMMPCSIEILSGASNLSGDNWFIDLTSLSTRVSSIRCLNDRLLIALFTRPLQTKARHVIPYATLDICFRTCNMITKLHCFHLGVTWEEDDEAGCPVPPRSTEREFLSSLEKLTLLFDSLIHLKKQTSHQREIIHWDRCPFGLQHSANFWSCLYTQSLVTATTINREKTRAQSTNMRGAIFMAINSWNSSLHAYGRRTCDIYGEKTSNQSSSNIDSSRHTCVVLAHPLQL